MSFDHHISLWTLYTLNTQWRMNGKKIGSAHTEITEKIKQLWQLVSFVLVKLRKFSSQFEKFYFSISPDQNLIIDLKKYNWTFQKDFPYNLFSLRRVNIILEIQRSRHYLKIWRWKKHVRYEVYTYYSYVYCKLLEFPPQNKGRGRGIRIQLKDNPVLWTQTSDVKWSRIPPGDLW